MVSSPRENITMTVEEFLLRRIREAGVGHAFGVPGVLIAEDGTSYGAFGLRLPPDCTFVSQVIWGSIGSTVGSLLGTLTAAPERRHLLFAGDGSFQLTAQELSTMLRHDCKPVIFLINNGGYTIERCYLGKALTSLP
jgi:indolepyruvate decarboxylase